MFVFIQERAFFDFILRCTNYVDEPNTGAPTFAPLLRIAWRITIMRADGKTPVTPLAAYTIPKFCAAHDISVRFYFKMRDAGFGPREMRIGRSVRISLAAAADWAAAREKADS